MKDVKSKCYSMIDLSKFIFNKMILSEIVFIDCNQVCSHQFSKKKKKKKVSQTVITHSNTNSLSVVFEGDSKVVLLALKMVMKLVDFEGDSQVFPFLLQNL